MFKKIIFVFLYFILALGYAYSATLSETSLQGANIGYLDSIKKNDRILILAPHPDDETIGCAGIIQQAVKKGADIHIVYLTNGDHNEFAFIVYEKRITFRSNEFVHMGRVRQKEALKAAQILGVDKDNVIFLGYPDFGTFTMFKDYWETDKPHKSMMTRISKVPYKNSLSFGAPYVAESILEDLKTVLLKYRPSKVFVSHPLDVNSDHKAFYLFLEVALSDLENELPRPDIYPYLVHCPGWPLPRHFHPELSLTPPKEFLNLSIYWFKNRLSQEQINKKYEAILAHRSQTRSSAFYLLAFVRNNELFGGYPEVYLTMPEVNTAVDIRERMSLKDRFAAFLGLSQMFSEKTVNMSVDLQNPDNDIDNKVKYRVDNTNFIISVSKPKEKVRSVTTLIHLFGYSKKTPFPVMPKIRIITRYNKIKVFQAGKEIDRGEIKLEMPNNELIIKVPLKLLGEPDFLLASVRAYNGIPPVHTTGFRKIHIRRE